MKWIIGICFATLAFIIFVRYDEAYTQQKPPEVTELNITGVYGGMLTYRTVIIEGQEYYISRSCRGYWVLGPKKESK